MKTPIRKNERVLNLLAYLLKSSGIVPFSRIRQDVEGYNDRSTPRKSINRRFERDKETLRALGVSLVYSLDRAEGVWGYTIPRGERRLGSIKLTDDQVRLLLVLAAFSGERYGPLHENLASACQKILAQNSLQQTEHDLFTRHIVYSDSAATDKTFAANLELLATAIEERSWVEFTYYSINRDKIDKRVVAPYGLKFWRSSWYLVGMTRQGPIRVFRLDRIRGRTRLARPEKRGAYDIPSDFLVDNYVGRSQWELSRAKPVEVIVSLDDIGAWLVEEARPSGLVLEKRGIGALARLAVSSKVGFFRWILALGIHARIQSPPEVVRGYKAFLDTVENAWRG